MEKIPSLFLIFLLIMGLTVPSTFGNEEGKFQYWIRNYIAGSTVFTNMKILSNGDIVIIGYTSPTGFKEDTDVLVMILSPDGKIKWAKTYGGNDDDRAYAVTETNGGDIIVAGYTKSVKYHDIWVLRIDTNSGEVKWEKTYENTPWNEAYDVATTSSGDIVVVGATVNTADSINYDLLVLKLDKEGRVKWAKSYGGRGDERAKGVFITDNGNIVVVGYTNSFGSGKSDAWVLMLNGNGSIIWQKTYGAQDSELALDVTETEEGNIVVVGETRSFGMGSYDAWIMMLNSTGEIMWQIAYGGRGTDFASSVVQINGDIMVAGELTDGYKMMLLMRISKEGVVKWVRKLSMPRGHGWANAIDKAEDGVILCGPAVKGNIIMKTSPNGSIPVCRYWTEPDTVNFKLTTSTAKISPTNTKPVNVKISVDQVNPKVKPWNPQTMLFCPHAVLRITSVPSHARVYVNGTYLGTTPLEIFPKPGRYSIKLRAPNYEEYISNITIKIGENKTMHITLVPLFGYLQIESEPPEAEVYINGNYKGITPIKLKLSKGTYEVKVSKDGYVEYVTNVTITSGQITTLSVTLNKTKTENKAGISSSPSTQKHTSSPSTPLSTSKSSRAPTSSEYPDSPSKAERRICGPGLLIFFITLTLLMRKHP